MTPNLKEAHMAWHSQRRMFDDEVKEWDGGSSTIRASVSAYYPKRAGNGAIRKKGMTFTHLPTMAQRFST